MEGPKINIVQNEGGSAESAKPASPETRKAEGLRELTLEEKYRIVGKKDSILNKRGVELSILRLEELLGGVSVVDENDFESIADAVLARHVEEGAKIKQEALSSEEIKAKKLEVDEYVIEHGIGEPHSRELIDDWVKESEKWVTSEGTVRANIIHNLRVMDLMRAGGDMDRAFEAARDAYRMAVKEKQWDIVDDILEEFPQLGQETSLE